MKKQNYTHVQALLPEIKAMLAEGKTQREIAEYYGFLDKQVVKGCLNGDEEKSASWKQESFHGPKAGRGKMLRQEILRRSRPMRSSGCVWRISCCGIFRRYISFYNYERIQLKTGEAPLVRRLSA